MENTSKSLEKKSPGNSSGCVGGESMELGNIEGLHQKLLEAAPDAMVLVGKSGRIELINAQTERLFGYSRGELIGKNLEILIPERFRKQHEGHMAGFFAGPRTRLMGSGLKIYGLKKDGTEFRADISLSPLDAGGELLVMAAIRDITERVRAEEQIELDYHIQRVISTVLQVALEPIPIDEQNNRILDLILSIPEPALQARGLIYLRDEPSDLLVLKAQRGFTEGEKPFHHEPFRRPDRQRGLSCALPGAQDTNSYCEGLDPSGSSFVHHCIPICEGEKVLGLISILTKEGSVPGAQEEVFLHAVAHTLAIILRHYQIEGEKERLIEQLSLSEKYAALGRISANVADEIRNPLTVVGGFARRLHKGAAEKTKERQYADFIISEVNRLEEILKEILNYSKTSALELKEESVEGIVDDVLKIYGDMWRARSITIQRSYGFTPDALIDKRRAREVIINVITNAIEAMPRGGTIAVSTSREDVEGESFVTVRISDTGEGIPEDLLPKIFEPFFTTQISRKATGLGLSIGRKIMEEHGGFIKVESKKGAGSIFSLYFPIAPGNKNI